SRLPVRPSRASPRGVPTTAHHRTSRRCRRICASPSPRQRAPRHTRGSVPPSRTSGRCRSRAGTRSGSSSFGFSSFSLVGVHGGGEVAGCPTDPTVTQSLNQPRHAPPLLRCLHDWRHLLTLGFG